MGYPDSLFNGEPTSYLEFPKHFIVGDGLDDAKISELRSTKSNCDTSVLRMQAEKTVCAVKVPWGDPGGGWQPLSY